MMVSNLKSLLSHSIKARVTLFTLSIFVLGLWALSFYASIVLRQEMQRLLGEQQFSVVSLVANDIDQELSDRKAALEQVASGIDARLMASSSNLQALLRQRPILQAMFNGGILVTDPSGTAIADVPLSAGRVGTNYMDRHNVSVTLTEGKTVIGTPVMGKKLGAPVFSLSAPIVDGKGKVLGALVGTVNLGLPSFLDKVPQGHYGRSGAYLLTSVQSRLIVTATDPSRVMQPLPPPGVNAMLDRYLKGYEGYGVSVNARGVEELSAAKGIAVAGWLLGLVVPTGDAFAPIVAMQQQYLLATALLTLLAGSLTWWMLRRELDPLQRTAKALAQIGHSKRVTPALPVPQRTEIGELVGAFNQLLQTLGQREAGLLQSEVFKSGILNAMSSHIAVLDHNGVIVAVNTAWARFAQDNGSEPGQAAVRTDIGVNYLEICQNPEGPATEGAQTAANGIPQVLRGKLPSFSLEYPCHAPGEQRWFHLMATPLGPSEEAGVVVVHTNISEQKLIEIQLARYRDHLEEMVSQQTSSLEHSNAALAESEALFRMLALNTSDGLAVFENNLIVYVSPTYLALLGFEKQEEMGRGEDAIKALIHPDDVEGVLGTVYSAMQSKLKSIVYTYRARHKKGHYIWREDSTRFTYDDQGQPHRIYVVARDVTESVLSQRAMEEHQLSLQVCFDNQQTGSAVFSETGLLYCNPAFRSLLGYTAKQSLSHLTMEGLVPSADRTYLRARHKRAKAYGETLSPKLMKLTGNEGATVTCLVSGSIVAWSGEPQFLASVTPLGDSVLVEQEIRASEERYERLLVTQLEQQQAHIARELHDSLGSRLAGVAMLLGGVLQKSPELGAEMKVALDQVQIAAQASRVLAHSLVPVDALPGAFWRSLQRLCLDYAKLAGVQCLFSMNGGFEEVDAETGNHLFRIAQEALVNAVKHGHASRIEVSLEERQNSLALTVVDNGHQLAPPLGSAGSSSGIGLKSMQARAKIIGGAFKWYVNDDGGVTVSIVWGLEPI